MIHNFLFILSIFGLSRAMRWDLTHGHGGSFNDISSDNSVLNHDMMTQHSWNKIMDPLEKDKGQHIKGLDTWLSDVVVGKDYHGLIKPVIKEIGYPVLKDYQIKIPYPDIQQVSQPYPILVPMLHPVRFEVVKTIFKTIEKKVPTPVEKIVPVPVEKPVPFEVVKHIPMFVEKKIPIKIPVYKTIHHKLM